MDCSTLQEKWLELLAGRLAGAEGRLLQDHRNACPACEKEASALEAVWVSLDTLESVETPGALRESALSRVHGLLEQELGGAQRPGLRLSKLLLAVLAGIALAGLGLWSLHQQVDLKVLPLAITAACAAWWTGLFALASSLILGQYRYRALRLGPVSAIGAASAGLLLVAALFFPRLELASFWQASALGAGFTALAGLGGSYLAFGALYAMVPTLAVSLYFGRSLCSDWLRHGVVSSVVFLLLIAPSLYVQCCYVSLSLAAFLTFGMALGSFGGTLGGLGVCRLRHAWA